MGCVSTGTIQSLSFFAFSLQLPGMSAAVRDHYSSAYNPILQVNDGEAEQDADYATNLRLRREAWWMKLVPLCILIPTSASLAVLILHLRQYKDSGTLYVWSTSSRVVVQVVVFVLASFLSLFWVFSIRTAISQWTRHGLSKRSINLDTLRLWSAITQNRADWNLPWAFAFATLSFFALSCVPATLWAGALTPALTYSEVTNISLLGKNSQLVLICSALPISVVV